MTLLRDAIASNREADKNVRSGDYGKATQALLLLKVDAIISSYAVS